MNASELHTFATDSPDTCAVHFDDVALAAEAVLKREDEGFVQVLGTLSG